MSETLKFLCRQFFLTHTKVNPQKSNLCGQTGIVTGSNIGLGLEASRQLLELGLSRYFDMQDRYYTSQLLQEIALIELCCTVPSSKGIVNVVNCGFCYGSALHTEVTTRFRVLGIIATFAKRMIGRSTCVNARTLVDAAVVQGPASHGQYLSDCARYTFPLQLAGRKGEALVKRVWNETLKELAFANVEGILSSLEDKEMIGKQGRLSEMRPCAQFRELR